MYLGKRCSLLAYQMIVKTSTLKAFGDFLFLRNLGLAWGRVMFMGAQALYPLPPPEAVWILLKKQTLNKELSNIWSSPWGLCVAMGPLNVPMVPHVAHFIHRTGLM